MLQRKKLGSIEFQNDAVNVDVSKAKEICGGASKPGTVCGVYE